MGENNPKRIEGPNMSLIETLAWAAVELESKQPDVAAIKNALNEAMARAAQLEINFEVNQTHLIRLAQVGGL